MMQSTMTESALFLSGSEIATLTGFKTTAKQAEWLRKKCWRFEVNGNGKPIVARKYTETMLGCGAPEERTYRPNFSAMKGA